MGKPGAKRPGGEDALLAAWALRTMQFASGVEPTIANLRVQIGRYTATGKANGIRIHRRSEQMSATC